MTETETKSQTPQPGLVQSQRLPLSALETNRGQIPGLPPNPRSISEIKYGKLKKSIEEQPDMLPLRELLVARHPQKAGKYVIIGGNMRFRALKDLGYREAVCKIIPDGTSIPHLRGLMLKDNSEFGEWIWEELANGFEVPELDAAGIDLPDLDTDVDVEEDAKEDNYDPEDDLAAKKARTQPGDIYQLGGHRLVCGDSTDGDVLDILCGQTPADLMLTDPPYNVDYGGKTEALQRARIGRKTRENIENDKMTPEQFGDFLHAAFRAAAGHIREGGVYYCFYASIEAPNFIRALQDSGLLYKQQLIWVKNCMVIGFSDYQWRHEPILYGWKAGAGHYFTSARDQTTVYEDALAQDVDKMTKDAMRDTLKRLLAESDGTTVFHEPKPAASPEHPTMKPVKLVGRLMRNSTRKGDVVLDPFAGSGTTLVAAEQLGRRCFAVEMEPLYCDVIVHRWEQLTGTKAELIGNMKA